MKKILSLMGIAWVFAGCATLTPKPHERMFVFIDKTNGKSYSGQTIGGTRNYNGPIRAIIEDKIYQGTWVYTVNGGSYSHGSGSTGVYSGGIYGVANTNISNMNVPTQGSGVINISDSNGAVIRCTFGFSSLTQTGVGDCKHNDGKLFDLVVH